MKAATARHPARVLVVDDSSAVRTILASAIDADPDLELVGLARSGADALRRIPACSPDVISLDVEMPDMDGLEFLAELERRRISIPVVVFSSLTKRGCDIAVRALLRGARDCVLKPQLDEAGTDTRANIAAELFPALKRAARSSGGPLQGSPRPAPEVARTSDTTLRAVGRQTPRPKRPSRRIVVVAASTGGPAALAELLGSIPVSFPVPIAVVQHIQPPFLPSLAARLDGISSLDVRVVESRTTVAGGGVWLAPAGLHLAAVLDGEGIALVPRDGEPVNSCLPSADVLFTTASQVCGAGATGVVLTGMGTDGLKGSEAIRSAEGVVLAQDQATSVVWGMPGSVANAGAADHVLPLTEIAREILMIVRGVISLPRGSARDAKRDGK